MDQGIAVLAVPVTDLDQAKKVYGALLDAEPYVDAPYYVGYKVGDQELGLDPNGHSKATGPIAYWPVADINKQVEQLLEAGAQTHQEVKDVGGGQLTAILKDADGNVIGLMQRP